MEPHFYSVDVNWIEDRRGIINSTDFNPNKSSRIEVVTPPQFPKGIPDLWSPEHLFTAAVSSCFMTTFLSIAENSKLSFTSFTCKSSGKLEQVEGKFIMSEVTLEPSIIITDEKDIEKAERILQKSEAACLISNSIKSKINLIPTVKVLEAGVLSA